MSRQVLIIHGWSDVSDSFRPLAKFLAGHGYDPVDLWLGDYISLEDDVGVRDVGKRMDVVIKAMIAAGRLNAQFDMVVHSTGGLVARQWIVANYGEAPQTCPVKRLVMLAPANFGSKLAATGKSFLGRIIKGYNNWFETGRTMLENLELASAFQWELASQDLLTPPGGTTTKYYGKDLVWPFVIVGTHPYTGALRQIVNENGSDGTVRACAANLNCTGVTIDFREQEGDPGFTRVWDSRLEHPIPFAVLATRTHATIIDPDRTAKDSDDGIEQEPGEDEMLGELILQALGCQDFEGYKAIEEIWASVTEATASRPASADDRDFFHQYFQVNARARDDYGTPVKDYFLEFYSNTTKKNDDANVYMHRNVIEDVKVNSIDASLRNFYFDRTDLVDGYYPMLPSGSEQVVYMSVSAASPGDHIFYFDKRGAMQEVAVHEAGNSNNFIKRNTTVFVDLILPRNTVDEVFKLKRL